MQQTISPLAITLMVYTYPVLFAGFVGTIVWIWRERVYESTTSKLKEEFNNQMSSDRHNVKNYADNIKGNLEVEIEKLMLNFQKSHDQMVRQINRLVTQVALIAQMQDVHLKADIDEDIV